MAVPKNTACSLWRCVINETQRNSINSRGPPQLPPLPPSIQLEQLKRGKNDARVCVYDRKLKTVEIFIDVEEIR